MPACQLSQQARLAQRVNDEKQEHPIGSISFSKVNDPKTLGPGGEEWWPICHRLGGPHASK